MRSSCCSLESAEFEPALCSRIRQNSDPCSNPLDQRKENPPHRNAHIHVPSPPRGSYLRCLGVLSHRGGPTGRMRGRSEAIERQKSPLTLTLSPAGERGQISESIEQTRAMQQPVAQATHLCHNKGIGRPITRDGENSPSSPCSPPWSEDCNDSSTCTESQPLIADRFYRSHRAQHICRHAIQGA